MFGNSRKIRELEEKIKKLDFFTERQSERIDLLCKDIEKQEKSFISILKELITELGYEVKLVDKHKYIKLEKIKKTSRKKKLDENK